MKIEPKYVTFEQGKLLKEKGFNVSCQHFYELALTTQEDGEDGYSGPFGWKRGELNLRQGYFTNGSTLTDFSSDNWFMCAVPEQWQVVEWLRINHDIWIVAFPELLNGEEVRYYPSIFEQGVGEDINEYFDSPQEAYSASITYILENLI